MTRPNTLQVALQWLRFALMLPTLAWRFPVALLRAARNPDSDVLIAKLRGVELWLRYDSRTLRYLGGRRERRGQPIVWTKV